MTMAVLTPTRLFTAPTPSKMTLPVELLEQIVDYMPVPTQLVFARTSHAMRDMVYDDTRWVTKLKSMGAWNEDEARRAAEEEVRSRREAIQRAKQEAVLGRQVVNGSAAAGMGMASSTTLFDVNVERRKYENNSLPPPMMMLPVTPVKNGMGDLLEFGVDSPEAFGDFQSVSPEESPVLKPVDTLVPLTILDSVLSRRGHARQEFGKVYKTLAPLYIDLANANSLDDSAVFRQRTQPEEQAKLLKVLDLFGRARAVDNWTRCQKRIAWITETFERGALTEFEEYLIYSQETGS
jgi:recyclin-1